jgi:hypothetical protein
MSGELTFDSIREPAVLEPVPVADELRVKDIAPRL